MTLAFFRIWLPLPIGGAGCSAGSMDAGKASAARAAQMADIRAAIAEEDSLHIVRDFFYAF